jgi:hypothetical protein
MLHSTRHIRGARAIFAMLPSYSGLVHYMASSTVDGAPVKRGVLVLPLALASRRMSRRIGQMDPN